MTGTKLHSPVPYFLLTALMGLVPVLNNKYPAQFFPAFSPWLVEVVSVFVGITFAFWGFSRGWEILQRRSWARELVRQAIGKRQAEPKAEENEISNAGRLISRLVRNVDEDLMEIMPDFTGNSLKRLQGVFPLLLDEIRNEEDALIRLGVVGTYLGETACRNFQWQWFFQTDPALRQFNYLASTLRKTGKELDPYAWAGELLVGKKKVEAFLRDAR